MVKEIWKYLHKPRYVDPGQLDGEGRTAAQMATANGEDNVVALLQGLGVDMGVAFNANGDADGDE